MASPRRSRHSRSGSESEDGAIRDGGDRHRHRRRRTDSRDRRDDSPRGRGSYRDHPSDRRDEPRRRQRSRTPPPRSVPDLAPATAFPSGGAYIPPARLRQMQAQITDRSSPEYQRMSWEALKKSINGYVNKVNTSNIKEIIPELLSENLIRGRGLFTRSIMKAQAASSSYTPVYAALVAVVNTKLPAVGELLLHRLVLQFRRAFRQNNKPACLATTTFIAHLTNQKLVNEILAFQILQLLFDNATDDSVEVAIGFMKACGAYLTEIAPRVTDSMFDILRSTLHEADIDQRVQYMIEVLFQIRKTQFKDYP
ncbi:pre-mRNA-splicing factor cwc22, partial [Tieghemiomyces parasiticus]